MPAIVTLVTYDGAAFFTRRGRLAEACVLGHAAGLRRQLAADEAR